MNKTESIASMGILDAKSRLMELCGDVARTGESVWLCRQGRPVAELRPLRREAAARAGARVPGDRPPGILDLWQECRLRFGPLDHERSAHRTPSGGSGLQED